MNDFLTKRFWRSDHLTRSVTLPDCGILGSLDVFQRLQITIIIRCY